MSIKSFLAFSCVHLPFEDKAGVDWLIDQIATRQPQVIVNLGDTMDTQSLSKFSESKLIELAQEFDAANVFCQRINEAAPKAKKVWMMGNHEERMFRESVAHLSRLLDYRLHIKAARKWTHIPYTFRPDHTFTLGQVTFAHGFHTSDTACKAEAVKLGVENGLYVHGHTHRPHDPHRINYGSLRLKNWIANPGCFIRPGISYMATKDDSLWGQGLISGWANTKRRADTRMNWEAELVKRGMVWEMEAA